MTKRQWSEKANRWALSFLLTFLLQLTLLVGRAQAQVVQDCQPSQFVDRTAANADRELNWDFSIASDPERCMQVRAGQTVFWNGVMDSHPLAGSGGDNPNPISLHNNGLVTFSAVGTYGFVCLNHSSMKGAIKVIAAAPAPAAAAPAISWWLVTVLTGLLLGSASLVLRRRGGLVR